MGWKRAILNLKERGNKRKKNKLWIKKQSESDRDIRKKIF